MTIFGVISRRERDHRSMIVQHTSHEKWAPADRGTETRVSTEESVCQICGGDVVQQLLERR